MRHLEIKKWFEHGHMSNRHDFALRLEHLVHDERFWAVVVLLLLLTFTVMAILFHPQGIGSQGSMPDINFR